MYNIQKILIEKHYQILVSVTATSIVISAGMQYGWSSPIIPFLLSETSHIKISLEDETWLKLTYFIGSLAIFPITASLGGKYGRHKLILLCSVVSVAAWIIIALAKSVVYLYVARVLTGAAANLLFVVVPIYVSEIADQYIRGFSTALIYVMLWIGLITIYATGPFVPFYVPSLIIVTLLVIQIVIFSFMPESPYFLIFQEKEEAAKKSLQKLRQTENVEDELERIAMCIKMQREERSRGLKKLIVNKSTIKAFLIVTGLNTFQLFSGLSVMLMNVHSILEEAESIYIESSYSSVIYAILTLVSLITCSLFVDKFARRIFLIISSFFTGLCLLCLAIYFNFKHCNFDTSVYSWVPVVCVFFIAIIFNIGLGVIPKIIASEVFSDKIKTVGLPYGDLVLVIMGLLSVLFFNSTSIRYGMHVPIYVFAGTAFLTVVFTFFVIPETKGKTLQEIQVMLEM